MEEEGQNDFGHPVPNHLKVRIERVLSKYGYELPVTIDEFVKHFTNQRTVRRLVQEMQDPSRAGRLIVLSVRYALCSLMRDMGIWSHSELDMRNSRQMDNSMRRALHLWKHSGISSMTENEHFGDCEDANSDTD